MINDNVQKVNNALDTSWILCDSDLEKKQEIFHVHKVHLSPYASKKWYMKCDKKPYDYCAKIKWRNKWKQWNESVFM